MKTEIIQELTLPEKARKFAEGILGNTISKSFCYHNLEHTQKVAKAVGEIGKESNLSPSEMEVVITAAWLHDTGYCHGCVDHEKASQVMSQKFLRSEHASEEFIKQVLACIEATKWPQKPRNLLEQVLCDADLFHLATSEYPTSSELLRQEINNTTSKSISERDWLQKNASFISQHTYFTRYAKSTLDPQKKKNLEAIKLKLKRLEELPENIEPLEVEDLPVSKKKKDKKKKGNSPERGIETMFRTTSRNHIDLSSIADNKANIMISVNSIIVSILLSVLFRKFEEFPNLIIPGLILTVVCLLTIVFAILATRPNVTSGTFTKEDLLQNKTNLLFFGNFHKMNLEDYDWGVKELMKDSNLLYSSMTKDIYFLGGVLGKKYRLLRIAYNIFMFGLIISVISFAIAILFFSPHHPLRTTLG